MLQHREKRKREVTELYSKLVTELAERYQILYVQYREKRKREDAELYSKLVTELAERYQILYVQHREKRKREITELYSKLVPDPDSNRMPNGTKYCMFNAEKRGRERTLSMLQTNYKACRTAPDSACSTQSQ